MKRIALATVFAAIACSMAFAKSGTFSSLSASVTSFNQRAPLYTTDQERLVSAIAGSILNIAAFADRFEPGDSFQVRNVTRVASGKKYSLQRRAEIFTVEVGTHVWAPKAYGKLARSFMADGAGLSISEDPAADQGGTALENGAGGVAIGRENARLSRLLQAHPRSSALHERAAMLLALAAADRATGDGDIRPLLCRMTAHLAVARALHGDRLSADGQLAERLLAQLSDRELTVARTGQLEARLLDGPVTFGDRPTLEIVPTDGVPVAQR